MEIKRLGFDAQDKSSNPGKEVKKKLSFSLVIDRFSPVSGEEPVETTLSLILNIEP